MVESSYSGLLGEGSYRSFRWRQGWSGNVTISVGKGLVSGVGAGAQKRALFFQGLIIPRGQCATEMH